MNPTNCESFVVYGKYIDRQAVKNNSLVVSKWLKDVSIEDTDTRDSLAQVLQQAAQCLSIDVIGMFNLRQNLFCQLQCCKFDVATKLSSSYCSKCCLIL